MTKKTEEKIRDAIILDPAETFKIEREEAADEKRKKALAIPDASQSAFNQLLVASKEIDIEKVKTMQGMFDRAQDREAERLFSEDFAKMQPSLPLVIAVRANSQTNSKYAKHEDINEKIKPILKEHGFGISAYPIEQNDAGVKVKVILRHRAGHKEEAIVFMPLDKCGIAGTVNKTMPHAHSSSMRYAIRLGICLLLDISTGDDMDGNLPTDTIAEEIVGLIKEKIAQFEPDYTVKFLKYMKAESVEKILANDTKRAFNALAQKKKDFEANLAKQKGETNG